MKVYIIAELWRDRIKAPTLRYASSWKELLSLARRLRAKARRESRSQGHRYFMDPIACRWYRAYELKKDAPPINLHRRIIEALGVPKEEP